MTDETHDAVEGFGPIDSLAIAFPGGVIGAEGFNHLLALSNAGTINVLDLEFVTKDADGSVSVVEPHDLAPVEGLDLAIFDGASSGLYTQEDLDEVASFLDAGDVAALIIYEELSLLPAVAAWEQAGGRVIGDGPVTVEELVIALDATEH
ncbi:MAG: DUF6325 family protein [Thermomicrobiales bacterium]